MKLWQITQHRILNGERSWIIQANDLASAKQIVIDLEGWLSLSPSDLMGGELEIPEEPGVVTLFNQVWE